MIDVGELLIVSIKDLIVVVLGFYITFKYIFPKVSSETALATADAIVKHEKVQPWITKDKEAVEKLEPFIEKLNELDVDELVETIKGFKVIIEHQNRSAPPPPPDE